MTRKTKSGRDAMPKPADGSTRKRETSSAETRVARASRGIDLQGVITSLVIEKMPATADGLALKISRAEAMLEQTFRAALRGDARAMKLVVADIERYIPHKLETQTKFVVNREPIGQRHLDLWHMTGLVPPGSSTNIEDYTPEVLVLLYKKFVKSAAGSGK